MAVPRNLTRISLQVFSLPCVAGETEPASTPIVELIQGATFIKHLVLSLEWECCPNGWNVCGPAICEAVCQNPSIRTLILFFPRGSGYDLAPVAGLLYRSRGLRKLTLTPPDEEAFAAFITELSKPELANNYSMQDLAFFSPVYKKMTERLAIQDILLKNRALAKRAARFVTGTRVKYTADAFEKVCNFTTLVDELQATAFVEEAEAKELISRCVLRLADFTEFMRLAGVVRDGIECSARDDGKTQLGDLPDLCLRRIRRFLRLNDVLDSSY
ncbi:hypothetical protein V5799_013651 [Amblyomma americanum]|uniref:Secreted protein n=1 Tax=Amblyomma americanum TaxID=6943 RepID=A0AAQ4E5A4_AMBAM